MSETLAEILGWEEGAVYKYEGQFFKVKNGMLLGSLTGDQSDWFVDWVVMINEIPHLKEAIKVEPKKYYLKHKFLREEETNYLGSNTYHDRLDVAYPNEGEFRKTKFTNEEIEKIEATGFDLRNFEKVEVEDE